MTTPALSIVIPVFNEATCIKPVVKEAIKVFETGLESFEIIVVDDGSGDNTIDVLRTLKASDRRVRVIRHSRRSGKSAGLRTGFLAARALWVATMDGDGQNDPRSVIDMVRAVDLDAINKVGLVAGCRMNRTDGFHRRFATHFANGLRCSLLRDACPDTACGLKLMPRDLFLALPFFDALHRYLPALSRHLGYKTVNVTVTNRPRVAGESRYTNIGRAAAGLFDLLGVIWLMRRTHYPDAHVLRGAGGGDEI